MTGTGSEADPCVANLSKVSTSSFMERGTLVILQLSNCYMRLRVFSAYYDIFSHFS